MNAPSNRTPNTLRWVARTWSLPAIIFVLGEVIFPHGGSESVLSIEWLTLGLMITAVIGLAVAWLRELAGSILSLVTMLTAIVIFGFTKEPGMLLSAGLVWLGFVILPADLFLYCALNKKASNLTTA